MQLPVIQRLYAHMEWADANVWEATPATAGGTSDDQLLDTLLHLHLTQRVFLQLWNGEAPRARKREEFESAQDLKDWAQEYHGSAKRFIDELSDARLSEVIDIPWAKWFEEKIGRPAAAVTVGESAYQVVAHSMYHRGQANRRLREIGAEPPLVDYIAWLWMDKPEPKWIV